MDGGSVFGVVPKVMWEKLKAPDPRNRILMATNCLLVRTPDANVLIEAGIGPKLSEKERDIYAYDRDPGLPDALAGAGLKPQDIDLVVLSHLHFDHVGALVAPGRDGELTPLFPRAKHVVQAGELEAWRHPDPRSRSADDQQDFGTTALALATNDVVAGFEVHGRGAQNRDRLPAGPTVGFHRRHRHRGGLEGPGVRRDLVHAGVGNGHKRSYLV